MKHLKTLLFTLALPCAVSAQEYFQQEVNYRISVRLDDVKHELNAEESIEYINNSPAELREIYMHLWPNAYKDNSTALVKQLVSQGKTELFYAKPEDRGYIDQLDFKVNGEKVRFEYDEHHTDIGKILLNQPLKSGDRITITTPFHVKLPKGIYSRLGHLDQAYQITQWYPKPAVYDKNGWNQMPYLSQGEFYSEFGSFDVSITLPRNYVVGATGDLPEGDPELDWLNQKAGETAALHDFPSDMSTPPSDPETKTLRYRQSNVHDFAWFADKRFHVLKGEITLPRSKRKVTSWALFTNAEAELWKKSIEYLNDATYYYSLWNGEYPYNHVTAVDGALTAGAGMEYPTITVIGTSGSAYALEVTIVHEVGHNWFYGVLGSNERKHAWMDEGINSFNEQRYMYTKYPAQKGNSEMGDLSRFGTRFNFHTLNHHKVAELTYLYNATRNADQPLNLRADKFTDINYGAVVYSKSALIFDYLKSYLGEETFDRAMKQYFEAWKFRHPAPEDLQKVMEESSGKKLDWFFNDLIQTSQKLDYKIVSRSRKGIKVKNVTGTQAPFSLSGLKDGEIKKTLWYEGFEGRKRIPFPSTDTVWNNAMKDKSTFAVYSYDTYKIDAGEKIPEISRHNNTLKASGLFRRAEPVKLRLIGSIPDPDKTEIYFFPATGWNKYDKLMYGVLFYNSLIPFRRFEYAVMPMYAFGTNRLVGGADIGYNWLPQETVARNVRLGVKAERFTYNRDPLEAGYNKIAPELSVQFRNSSASSTLSHRAQIRYIYLNQDIITYTPRGDGSFTAGLTNTETILDEFSYTIADSRKINPFSLRISSEVNPSSYHKGSMELNYTISYRKKKGIDIRLFTGVFFNSRNAGPATFKLSGHRGLDDYRFDEVFPGRSEYRGTLSRQFAEKDGAFKTYTPLGTTENWMAALNIKAALPGRLPLGLFADLGTFEGAGTQTYNTSRLLYDAGAYISLGGLLEVYFPFAMSKDIKDIQELNKIRFKDQIRFTLNLARVNPFQLLKNLPD
jgi:hypothetical protein